MDRSVGRRLPGLAARRSMVALGAVAAFACREPAGPRSQAVAEPAVAAARPAPARFSPAPEQPLGVATLAELGWAARAGQESFRRARAAERRGDWATMVEHCQASLGADASHLEASWLLAAGLAHLGRFDELGPPLARAVVGDPGKWAAPALQLPLFARYWESGAGDAMRPWIVEQQRRLEDSLGRAVILVHGHRLVAYDPTSKRWLPLARPHRVAAALVRRPWLAFVARTQSQGVAVERVGVVDLRTGGVQLTPVPAARRRELAILPGSESSPVLVRDDGGAWSQVVDGHLAPMRSPVPRALAPRLVLAEDRATLVRHPVPGVLADWDQLQMASALRIQRSNRVITVPAPALIDGQRLAFAPGAAHLALVAGLDACDRKAVPGASPQGPFRAYVVDAIAGVPRQVAQSERGLEVEWIDERTLAVGSERGVLLIDVAALDGEPAQEEPQAAGLAQRAGAVELAEVALPAAGRHSKCQEPTEPPQSEDLDEL